MNHRQIANLVASVITNKTQTDKIRAIRLFAEKVTGKKVEDTEMHEFLDAMVAVMDVGKASKKTEEATEEASKDA